MSSAFLHQLVAFASAYALVAVLPGPNLFVVAAASQMSGRVGGLKAAAGVALGASLLAAVSGLAAMRTGLAGAPVAGAATLVFGLLLSAIGWRVLAASFVVRRPVARRRMGAGSLLLGFATALANPISAGFFASYMLSAGALAGEGTVAAMAAGVFLVAGLWFGFVGLWLDSAPLRRLQNRHRRWLQTLCGAALIGLGALKIATLFPL